MTTDKISILLSDVSVQGDLIEKEKVVLDAKITGDITADEVVTHDKSNISGNIKAKKLSVGGKIKGNLSSDKIKLTKEINKEIYLAAL